jgi:hypothetical protein
MKFIPFQTFARVSSENTECAFTKLKGYETRNNDPLWCIFAAKEGVLGVAGKDGGAVRLERASKIRDATT